MANGSVRMRACIQGTFMSAPLSSLPVHELVACHECDLLMRKPQLADGESAQCPRCGYELFSHRHQVVRRSLALVMAALLLYIPANFLPIMQLNLLRRELQRMVDECEHSGHAKVRLSFSYRKIVSVFLMST